MVLLIIRSKCHSSRLTQQQQDSLYAGKDKHSPAIYLGAVTTSTHKEFPLTRHRSQCHRSTIEYSKNLSSAQNWWLKFQKGNLMEIAMLIDTQEMTQPGTHGINICLWKSDHKCSAEKD